MRSCPQDSTSQDRQLLLLAPCMTRTRDSKKKATGPPCCCLVGPRSHPSRDTGQLICISLHADIYVEAAPTNYMLRITLKRGNIKRNPIHLGHIFCKLWTYIYLQFRCIYCNLDIYIAIRTHILCLNIYIYTIFRHFEPI